MTFSIVGRCAETGQLGVALCSSSIAVGARCPWVQAGVGAVSTQNVTLPSLGPAVLDAIRSGAQGDAVLQQALRDDPHRAYRQLLSVDHRGASATYTGDAALGVFTAQTGVQCAAGGNLLASVGVIDAMVRAFEASPGTLLATRLLGALQAAVAAGGEAGPVHAAALLVSDRPGRANWPIVNLRVDWADHDPIGQLGALWAAYQPQMDAYLTRALDPTQAPSYGVPGDE